MSNAIPRVIVHVLVVFSRSDLEELPGHNLTGESRSSFRSVKVKCAGRTLLYMETLFIYGDVGPGLLLFSFSLFLVVVVVVVPKKRLAKACPVQ